MFDNYFSWQVSLWYEASMPRLRALLIKSVQRAWAWRSAPLYIGLIMMAGYAFWEARTPVTMITPFQLSKSDLPFNGEIVADADGMQAPPFPFGGYRPTRLAEHAHSKVLARTSSSSLHSRSKGRVLRSNTVRASCGHAHRNCGFW